jgi:hypothetical protein
MTGQRTQGLLLLGGQTNQAKRLVCHATGLLPQVATVLGYRDD